MKTKSLVLGILLVAALLLTACGGSATTTTTTATAVVKSVVFARGLDDSFQPVDPTTTFVPADTVRVSVGFDGNPTKGVLKGKWYLDTQMIYEVTLDLANAAEGDVEVVDGNSYTGLSLSADGGLPVGSYKLEIYIDDVKAGEYPFTVSW